MPLGRFNQEKRNACTRQEGKALAAGGSGGVLIPPAPTGHFGPGRAPRLERLSGSSSLLIDHVMLTGWRLAGLLAATLDPRSSGATILARVQISDPAKGTGATFHTVSCTDSCTCPTIHPQPGAVSYLVPILLLAALRSNLTFPMPLFPRLPRIRAEDRRTVRSSKSGHALASSSRVGCCLSSDCRVRHGGMRVSTCGGLLRRSWFSGVSSGT